MRDLASKWAAAPSVWHRHAKDDDAVSVAKSVMSDHKEVVGHVHSTKSVAAIASKAKEKLELVAEVAEEK